MATQEPENRSGAQDQRRVEALRQRMQDDPRSLAFVSLAEELNRIGQYEEAATVAQRGLLNHPDSVAGRLALAVAESEQDHVKEALEQIKRALIIDQENPKALALMGQILLKRGLAKRAVQFLSHAVKLAPTDRDYAQLLQQARRQASETPEPSGSPRPAVFNADAVPAEADPWSEDGDKNEADHTVFDPDAVKRLSRGNTSLRAGSNGEDPTAFQHPIPQPGLAASRNAKVGGSAAEYSQMMRGSQVKEAIAAAIVEGEGDATVSAAEVPLVNQPVHQPPPTDPPPPVPPAAIPGDSAATGTRGKGVPKAPSLSMKAPEPAAPKPKRDRAERRASGKSKDIPSFKAKSSANERPKPPSVKPAAKPDKRIGPVGTRMVDDALWVLFGKKGAADASSAPEADADGAAERAPAGPVVRSPGAEPRGPQPRVVRTGERFGTWVQVATMTVLSVTGALVGHWVMLSSAGPGPEVASEEVKGLASDLERGGLAALLSAEERAAELSRSAPDLEPLLNGVKLEIYGRRWRSFGRDRGMRAKAQSAIEALSGRRPTVEHLAGLVALSTSTAQRDTLLAELKSLARRYPESPKIRVLQAELFHESGRERAALNALHEAKAIHNHHRATLLALARWYRRSKAYGESLATYARLLDRYPLDVEAAIERYVLGQATGADPDEAQAVSLLAGLVRNEDPNVAKDETGRASLAFAVPPLAKGQLVEGIESLGKAEAAFEQSAVFKYAVAGAYLAVGEYDRAEALYKAAAKLEPKARAPKLGVARVQYAREAGIRIDLTRESERVARRYKAQRQARPGVARLPLGTLRLVPGRFELVRFRPDPGVFPEAAYRDTKDLADLPVVNLLAIGERELERGDIDAAIKRFEAALGMRPSAKARFALGRALAMKGEHNGAIRMLRAGLQQSSDNIPGRLALARSYMARGQVVPALETLEPLERSSVQAPDGLLWLGRLRTERGDYEGAISPLKTATELRPRDVDARLAYGEALHHVRRTDEAMTAFANAASMAPDTSKRKGLSPIALMYLGRAELERSKRRGVALLKKALKSETVPVEAHYYLGEALARSRRTRRQGRRELQRYVRIGPPGELRDRASQLLRRR